MLQMQTLCAGAVVASTSTINHRLYYGNAEMASAGRVTK
jgi:hypothetical protein